MTSLIKRANFFEKNPNEEERLNNLPDIETNVTSSFVMDGQGFDEYDVPVRAAEADEEFERLERDLQRLNPRDTSQSYSRTHENEEALPSESMSAMYQQSQMTLSEPERQLAELVQSKVAALNTQIERYTAEVNKMSETSAALANDRAKLDEEAKALSKEKLEFKMWRDSEHNRFETWKNELTAKMDKERRVAVRQARASAVAMNALPDRQERAELENLKKELVKVKADLSASEAKYKSAVERHRAAAAVSKDQISQLEAQVRKYEEERIAIVFGPNAVTSSHPQQTVPTSSLPMAANTEALKKAKKQQPLSTNSVLVQSTAPSLPLTSLHTVENRDSDIWADYDKTKSQQVTLEPTVLQGSDESEYVENEVEVKHERTESKGVIEDEYMDALLGRTAALKNLNTSTSAPMLTPAGISGSITYNPARYSSSASVISAVPTSSSTIFAPPAPTRLSGAPNAHVKEIPTEVHMMGSISTDKLSRTTPSTFISEKAALRTPATNVRVPTTSENDIGQHHVQGVPISRALRSHLETRISPSELGLGAAESGSTIVQQTDVEGPSGKTEMRFADGSRVVRFRNGTEKEQRPGGISIVRFNNGDIKRSVPRDISEGGGVVDSYYYASAGTLQTTYPHGIDVYEFPNGQIELHDSLASLKEILFNDGSVRSVQLNPGESQGSQMLPTNMNMMR